MDEFRSVKGLYSDTNTWRISGQTDLSSTSLNYNKYLREVTVCASTPGGIK